MRKNIAPENEKGKRLLNLVQNGLKEENKEHHTTKNS